MGDEQDRTDIDGAREALSYWERRARRLPRRQVRRRREARVLARRWEARVAAAERELYGRGLTGALLLVAFERRLPARTRRTGRRLARRTAQLAMLTAAAMLAVIVASAVLVAQAVAGLV